MAKAQDLGMWRAFDVAKGPNLKLRNHHVPRQCRFHGQLRGKCALVQIDWSGSSSVRYCSGTIHAVVKS